MRYSRIQDYKPEKKGGKGIFFFVGIFVVAATIYFVGASKVGAFISEKVITPVISWATGEKVKEKDVDPAASLSPEQKLETGDLQIGGTSIFALQAGVFEDENNAKTLAESLQQKGGAGHIYKNENMHYVFIAAYGSEEEAKNVQTRLEKEQSLNTKVFEIATEDIAFQVSTTAATLQQVKEAADYINTLQASLLADALELDKGSLSATDMKNKAEGYLSQVQAHLGNLNALDDKGSVALTAIKTFYQTTEQTMKGIVEKDGDDKYAALVKSAYLSVGFGKKDMATTIKAR